MTVSEFGDEAEIKATILSYGEGDMNSHEKLRKRFKKIFENWEIELPAEAMTPGVVWIIVQQGWTIWTRLDVNAEDGREYLDYYAMHRMTNDRHVRLYPNGDEEYLPAHYWLTSKKDDPTGEKARAHRQTVEQLLEEKGFVMTDQAHPSARLNHYLQSKNSDESDAAERSDVID